MLLENQGKIFANGQSQATSGGGVLIVADRVIAKNRSGITSSNFTASPSRRSDNADATRLAEQSGGATLIGARRIVLDDNSFISAFSVSGEGGGIGLFTDEYVALSDNSYITTSSFDTDDLSFRDGSGNFIGSGGDIDTRTDFLVGTPRRDNNIIATAIDGKGGKINVIALSLFDIAKRPEVVETNDVSAESRFGLNGVVTVNALNIDPSRSLDDLPDNRLPDLLAEGCRPNGRPIPKDKLYITDQGGMRPRPDDILRGNNLQLANLEADAVATADARETTGAGPGANAGATADGPATPALDKSPPVTSPPPPIAAQGWVRSADGKVSFRARIPNPSPIAAVPGYSSCGGNS